MENEKLENTDRVYTKEAIDKINTSISAEIDNKAQNLLMGKYGQPSVTIGAPDKSWTDKDSSAEEIITDAKKHLSPMAKGKHIDPEFGEDEGVEVEDNLFDADEFLSPLKMTEEEIEKTKNEINEIKGLVGNLVLEVEKAINNTIKTNYFEVMKTQREIVGVKQSINTCISIIRLRKEMEEMAHSEEKREDANTELADKIAQVNDEELIGSSNYDDLLRECEALNEKIDMFVKDSNAFIDENKERMKFTSNATAGIIEMLNHMIETGKDTMSEEEKVRLLSFIDIYEHRGETSLFDMFANKAEIEKSCGKFKVLYNKKKKKKKVIKRYIKTILGSILGKNNVNLFYDALVKLVNYKTVSEGSSQNTYDETLDMMAYVICRIIHLQKTDAEKLKAKISILSIFDMYYDVYDYENTEEIKERFSHMLNHLLLMRIASTVRKECKKYTYEFPVTTPSTAVEETK